MKNSVIGHFNLVAGTFSDSKPRERGSRVSGRQNAICTAVDLFIGNSVTCHIQLGSGGYSNVGGSASLHSKTLSGG